MTPKGQPFLYSALTGCSLTVVYCHYQPARAQCHLREVALSDQAIQMSKFQMCTVVCLFQQEPLILSVIQYGEYRSLWVTMCASYTK